MPETTREMPRYRCHKEVYALKISFVSVQADGRAVLEFSDHGYGPVEVTDEFVAKHAPKAGGYYVVYEDGYTSWSPAEPFESGYTRI